MDTAQGTPTAFGQWLKWSRTKAGLSQGQLATLAKIHRTQIVYLETGRTQHPSSRTSERLISILGEPPPDIDLSRRRAFTPRCSFCGATRDHGAYLMSSDIRKDVHLCVDCLRSYTSRLAGHLRENMLRQNSRDESR